MQDKGQQWPDCDANVKDFVNEMLDVFKNVLGSNLDAIYLHGSLAMGCFYTRKSDIDLLILVSSPITAEQHEATAKALLAINENKANKPHIRENGQVSQL